LIYKASIFISSGREDSNFRPLAPHASALANCATPQSSSGVVPPMYPWIIDRSADSDPYDHPVSIPFLTKNYKQRLVDHFVGLGGRFNLPQAFYESDEGQQKRLKVQPPASTGVNPRPLFHMAPPEQTKIPNIFLTLVFVTKKNLYHHA
jgi:hypothetical protein